MTKDEQDVENALKQLLGEEIEVATEFEAALDRGDMKRAKELLDLANGDGLQAMLMKQVYERWKGARPDEPHE